ncbi:MAG: DUF938 domain-containing protein [Pseudomonadota bacterium]
MRIAPAAERNKTPILNVIADYLKPGHRALELASGTGQHILYFAKAMPQVTWQPSEVSSELVSELQSVLEGYHNIERAYVLDVLQTPRQTARLFDAVLVSNLLHISPIEAVAGVFDVCDVCLLDSGVIHIYGPFHRDGHFTSPGNRRFDQSLRERDASWGIRDLEQVLECGSRRDFGLLEIVQQPANNFSLIFRRDRS